MDNQQYRELLSAILDLRNATELGFVAVNRRFDGLESRFDGLESRFDVLESRFIGLEARFEDGFRNVSSALIDMRNRLTVAEQHGT